ncbi:MAG: acyl-ACP--UDP-N-acetylglucosamine O-acyltransferase [Limnochordaceae bacterium]|nr:acyl-ACP--UDP-N-acetylglucosamine O-acyltransferase [Limnochordaceae bacterium]
MVAEGAELDESVAIGPYVVIEPGVTVAAGTRLDAFVVLKGSTSIGRDNRIGTGAVLGGEPQDLKYGGEPTRLVIGDANRIGAYVTISRGTPGGHGVTTIGNGNVLEDGAHVGHDCQVGDGVRLGAGAALAGHVVVDDGAEIGPLAGVHQFVHVGRFARIEGHAMVGRDVPPYVVVAGNPASVAGINEEAMRRRGLDAGVVTAVESALRLIYESGLRLEEAVARIERELPPVDEVRELVRFVRERHRGVIR